MTKYTDASEAFINWHVDGCSCPCKCNHKGRCNWCVLENKRKHERKQDTARIKILLDALQGIKESGCECSIVAAIALSGYENG